MFYLNPNIEKLYRVFDQNERREYIRLDLNENPSGLPQDFINDVIANVSPRFVSQYPETLHFSEILADYLGTDIEHICLTNGSSEGIRYIIQAFTSERGRIVGVELNGLKGLNFLEKQEKIFIFVLVNFLPIRN